MVLKYREVAWVPGKERTVFRGPFADWMRQAEREILETRKLRVFGSCLR